MTRSDSELGRVRPSVLEAHHANAVSPADIQRAYLRFAWARRKAPTRFAVLRWLSAGVAIGLGVASAATLLPPPKVHSAAPAERAETSAPAAKHHAPMRAARKPALNDEPTLVEPTPAASERSAAPSPLSSRLSNDALRVAPPRMPVPVPATAGSTASASDWQVAAAALRSGDLPTAEAALAKLEQSDSLRDRQAAELARAQLLVGSGRTSEAIPTLRRLALAGNSPVIRAQAASMLQNLAN